MKHEKRQIETDIYICEKCGKEFRDEGICKSHETVCECAHSKRHIEFLGETLYCVQCNTCSHRYDIDFDDVDENSTISEILGTELGKIIDSNERLKRAFRATT